MAAKPHAALRKKLLTYALSLPEAEEHHPWGENVAKAGGKIFFFGGRPENDFLAGLKLPLSRSAALKLPGAEPMGYGMGAHDWVTIWGAAASHVDLDLLRVWIPRELRRGRPEAPWRAAHGDGARGTTTAFGCGAAEDRCVSAEQDCGVAEA